MGRFTGKKCRLLTMLWLTTFFFFVEIIVGYVTNSMALIADSFHMLSDVAALVVAFLSVKMSPKKWSKNTFGWARAEVLGALVNAVFLVALCFSITVEACKRFIEIEEIHKPEFLAIVGALGLFVNLIGLCLFHEHGHGHSHSHSHAHGISRSHNRLSALVGNEEAEVEDTPGLRPHTPIKVAGNNGNAGSSNNVAAAVAVTTEHAPADHAHSDASQMNMRGVFLHVLSDALGSVIVVVSALIVWLTKWSGRFYIDPALSLLLVVLILKSVWPLLKDSALILLQTVPTHIQVDAIQQRLLENVDGVLAVHEFHVWQLAGDRIIASAHIRCRNLSEYMKIAEQVKEFFHNEGIHSTTIQPEFIDYQSNSHKEVTPHEDCVLDCPKTDKSCNQATCCGPSKQGRETPSPGETPNMCRQRNALTRSTNSLSGVGINVHELERGHLLSVTPTNTVSQMQPHSQLISPAV
ncbi:zinc transporter 1 [Trichogramma pretiosum]|uniref:zinc transporter 1 n=1 Tax=Trichogramma pretiosum TaxID=7493 RepID=UPI0006C95C17|nr:zinc transporter 1 [Trichogramma pretiosum]